MKNALRATALTCAVLCLTFSLSTSPAHAAVDNSDIVRTAQMRLANMGYYVGRYDGNMGPVTQDAIRDFQRTHGLMMTGQLSPETYSALLQTQYVAYRPDYYTVPMAYQGYYADPVLVSVNTVAPVVMWDDRWHYVHTQEVPTRYGRLDINEDNRGTLRHYAVTLNGQPVLFANNQPGVLRVSRTFALNGEDAVIFTAYHGDEGCTYKSYLLTVHSDGTFNSPREIGNCTSNYEAHVADNALFMSFPGLRVGSNWSTWDVWRYESNALVRL